MNWIQSLLARMGVPVGASLAADIATAQAVLTTLETRLSAIRAGYLDQLDFALQEAIAALQTDLDNPDQYKADLTTLETRLSAIRAGYLDQLDFDLQGALTTIAGYLDTEIAAILAAVDTEVAAIETKLDTPANFMADLTTLEARLSAARALLLDEITALRMAELDAANLPTDIANVKAETALIKTQTDKIAGKMLFSMDFWSLPQEEVALTVAAGDKALPSVTVADLPGAATIVRAIAMFKFRMVENHTYAGANSLDGAQEIQVAGAVDAINFVDTQFTLAQDTREGGDVIIGIIDIAATVNANGAYAFHWDLAKALQTGINFNDVQMGIRIWYSV